MFDVQTCLSVIEKFGLPTLLDDRCKAPDHSLLTVHFDTRIQLIPSTIEVPTSGENIKRYKVHNIPDNFLLSREAISDLNAMILSLENGLRDQDEVDHTYSMFVNCIKNEMDRALPAVIVGKSKKYFRPSKPYWNDNLSHLWGIMNAKEKDYLHFRGAIRQKNILREAFKVAANKFDKSLRRYEREYRKSQILNIEEVESSKIIGKINRPNNLSLY